MTRNETIQEVRLKEKVFQITLVKIQIICYSIVTHNAGLFDFCSMNMDRLGEYNVSDEYKYREFRKD